MIRQSNHKIPQNLNKNHKNLLINCSTTKIKFLNVVIMSKLQWEILV